jgi:uridylate kinase
MTLNLFLKLQQPICLNLSGKDVKAGTYEFFDTTAVQMIKRSDLETVITNGFEPENLIKAVNGETIGTRIINE